MTLLFTRQQNFRLVQMQSICRQQIIQVVYMYLRTENMLKGENAGFQHFFLIQLYFQRFNSTGLFVTWLILSKQTLVFTCLQYKSFEKTVGKGEIACNEQFLFFPQCFLPVGRTFCHFYTM